MNRPAPTAAPRPTVLLHSGPTTEHGRLRPELEPVVEQLARAIVARVLADPRVADIVDPRRQLRAGADVTVESDSAAKPKRRRKKK